MRPSKTYLGHAIILIVAFEVLDRPLMLLSLSSSVKSTQVSASAGLLFFSSKGDTRLRLVYESLSTSSHISKTTSSSFSAE